jgi:hypothetical protein
MKVLLLQQIADHVVRWRDAGTCRMAYVDRRRPIVEMENSGMDKPIGRWNTTRR